MKHGKRLEQGVESTKHPANGNYSRKFGKDRANDKRKMSPVTQKAITTNLLMYLRLEFMSLIYLLFKF